MKTPSRWNIGTDKSDPSFIIFNDYIQSSSDYQKSFFLPIGGLSGGSLMGKVSSLHDDSW